MIFLGFRNFAKEFEDVFQSKQDAQELFSSSAVALPLVALASFLLLREPLVEFLEGKNNFYVCYIMKTKLNHFSFDVSEAYFLLFFQTK